jgi:hypothetical protein
MNLAISLLASVTLIAVIAQLAVSGWTCLAVEPLQTEAPTRSEDPRAACPRWTVSQSGGTGRST